jgi:hypothetical protein
MKKLLLGIGLAALCLLPAAAQAAGGSVTVTPIFENITLTAKQPEASFDMRIYNTLPVSVSYHLRVADFGALDETGGIAFSGASTSSVSQKYALASWLSLEKDTVEIAAGESQSVRVTVENRESLSPGGHYGAVIATSLADPSTAKSPSVAVTQAFSSLIFVKKTGGETYGLTLAETHAKTGLFRLPASAELRFQNTGNVHVVPRGLVEVWDPRGRVVGRGVINEGSAIVLPESFRRLASSISPILTSWLPGRYQLVVTYRYDGSGKSQEAAQPFWFIPLPFLALLAILVGVTAAGAWWVRGRRQRKQHKASRAQTPSELSPKPSSRRRL